MKIRENDLAKASLVERLQIKIFILRLTHKK